MITSGTTYQIASQAETTRIAQMLGQQVAPGDCILLEGDVGAGKTHFARALIQSLLDLPEDVPSPTFTLVQTYDTSRGEVWHADLYRLTTPDELVELGLIEAFETAICLIEWPDRMADALPPSALHLALRLLNDREEIRDMAISWSDPKWDAKLKGIVV